MHKIILLAGIFIGTINACIAQTVATIENTTLATNTYWNGSSTPNGATFNSGNVIFPNNYSSAFGGYWESGWAYSNVLDTTTYDYTNNYGSRSGKGANNSATYAVANNNSLLHFNSNARGKVMNGFYVNNLTYSWGSMKNGDAFAKKFGGATGNDPDFFALTIKKYENGILSSDSVAVYLADFRFADNIQDYIMKDWTWVDLTSLGNVDSLIFSLSSSDMGQFGMNTPAYFCIDDFTTSDLAIVGISSSSEKNKLTIYPNPTTDELRIINYEVNSISNIKLTDAMGRERLANVNITDSEIRIDVSELPVGMYFVNISDSKQNITKSFVKK